MENNTAKYYLIKEDCPVDIFGEFLNTGKLPLTYLKEVKKEESLSNLSKTITYGLTAEQVKAHCSGSK